MYTWDDIALVAGGVAGDGTPLSAATLAVDTWGGGLTNKEGAELAGAVIRLYPAGDGMVVEASFPETLLQGFAGARGICMRYMAGHPDNDVLSITAVPFLLEGSLILNFSGLRYFHASPADRTLIFFFDCPQAIATGGGVDYNAALEAALDEVRRAEDELDDEVAAAEQELEAHGDAYGDSLREELGVGTVPTEEMERDAVRAVSPNFRISGGEDDD